jgi:hypothetical protein
MTKKVGRSIKPTLKAADRRAPVLKGSTRSSVPARKGMVRIQTCVRIPLIQGGKPLPPRAEDFTWITKGEYRLRLARQQQALENLVSLIVEAVVDEILGERELTR